MRRGKEMFGLGRKNTTDRRELWRFFITKPKEYLRRHTFHKASKLKSLVDWTIIRSIESGTEKTCSHIISYENKSPNGLIERMVQNGTTSIVCDRMMTQGISRSQSMPSVANPGQRVIKRAKFPY